MLDRIETSIARAGALSEEQRIRLREIAEKCPVHRTLTSEINIRSRLVDRVARSAGVKPDARQLGP